LRAAGSAGLAGLAGCNTITGGGGVETISVAYKPIFPFLQYLVMDERGYLDELDVEVEATNFADQGLNVVSAYSNGDIDVAFIGITPAIRMKHQGAPGAVTAANQTGGFVVLTTDAFADRYESAGADAFRQFREDEGRPFRFVTFPQGSVAYVFLRRWLDVELGVGTDDIEIENVAGAGPVRRSLLTGDADGTLVMEPIPTILDEEGAPFSRLTHTGAFMDGAPGGVTFMHDRLREDAPDLAAAFLQRHVRATELIREEPETAATAVSDALGENLSEGNARRAIESDASRYVSDPMAISEGTAECVELMGELGQIDSAVEIESILDPAPYRAATD
jgi:NitT/TauT family transport system substrate-binding protein